MVTLTTGFEALACKSSSHEVHAAMPQDSWCQSAGADIHKGNGRVMPNADIGEGSNLFTISQLMVPWI